MKQLSLLDLLRFWAAATGLLLFVWHVATLYIGAYGSPMLPLLITAIGGFELFLFSQDLWLKRRRSRG